MFNWITKRRERALEKEALRKVEEEREKLKRHVELVRRGDELKKLLIQAGIQPFNWCNEHVEDDFVRMYGVFGGRLVEAKLGRKGGLHMEYVKED